MAQAWQAQRQPEVLALEAGLFEQRPNGRIEHGLAVDTVDGQLAPRRIFRLTSAGRKALRDWLSRPVSHGREIRLEFMAKLFFARREGSEWVNQLIARQREECAGWREKLLVQAAASPGRGSFEWLVYQFRVRQVESMLDWLDQCAVAQPEPGAKGGRDGP